MNQRNSTFVQCLGRNELGPGWLQITSQSKATKQIPKPLHSANRSKGIVVTYNSGEETQIIIECKSVMLENGKNNTRKEARKGFPKSRIKTYTYE